VNNGINILAIFPRSEFSGQSAISFLISSGDFPNWKYSQHRPEQLI